jgi:hypothetical protein
MEDDGLVFMAPNPLLKLLDRTADDALDIKPTLSPTPSEIRHDSDTTRVSSESTDETRLLIAGATRHEKPPVKERVKHTSSRGSGAGFKLSLFFSLGRKESKTGTGPR